MPQSPHLSAAPAVQSQTQPSAGLSPLLLSPNLEYDGDKEWSSESNSSFDADHDRRPLLEMSSPSRWRSFNPMRFLNTNFSYQRLPGSNDSRSPSPSSPRKYPWPVKERWRICGGRFSLTKMITLTITAIVLMMLVARGDYRHHAHPHPHRPPPPPPPPEDKGPGFPWQHYLRLDGYYNGIKTLVRPSEYQAENRWNQSIPLSLNTTTAESLPSAPPLDPVPYKPYPDYSSAEYVSKHHPVQECYMDENETVAIPDVYAYPGVPQHMSIPFYGSYDALGLEKEMCFERFGRLGPYGYGYNESQGGRGAGQDSEHSGSEKVFDKTGFVDYSNVNWGQAQKRCHEKNKARFEEDQPVGKEKVSRQAYVLRTWGGYEYKEHQILSLRAMINELSLKSGGEYDVHLLVHIKNNSIPIWADEAVYNATLEKNVPEEFWNITTLWSEQLMVLYYPEPFADNFVNMAQASVHGVYRSAHFALQWFSQQHPEYDHFWNWEMDLRYSGHYYEFHNQVGQWAKQQPRKGMWERNSRFYIPAKHGDWDSFTKFVEQETAEYDGPANDEFRSGPLPVWGPVEFENTGMLERRNGTTPPTSYDKDNYEWGVGEDADLIVFNPIFDTAKTNWVFRDDVTGYNRTLPIPPRRAAIITVARLSKRLLNTMHEETWKMRHTMFPEMWPPSVCLHHGFKALYAPHPVYFDRDWDLEYMDQTFNYPSAPHNSPFGWGEHNMLGSSFYYNSGFSSALWRRWLGQRENGEGGRRQEEAGSGRMCLRGTLHHPVKHEHGPID